MHQQTDQRSAADPESVAFRFGGPLLLVLIALLWFHTRAAAPERAAEHPHPPAAQGVVVVSLAGDRYHVEALVEAGGTLRLFTLDRHQTQVLEVPTQSVTAYVRADNELEATLVPLTSAPQIGDRPGHTSQFVGLLPEELCDKPFVVSIPNLAIGDGRYRIAFAWPAGDGDWMHDRLSDETEQALYLAPAGKYTAADIAANGPQLPFEKFRGFRARHDFSPEPGDAVCPISRTKANDAFTWVVNGQRYEFCCPPCIDEFVALAKERPEQIQPPTSYVAVASGRICTGQLLPTADR